MHFEHKLELAEDFVHTSPFGEIRGKEVYLDMATKNSEIFFSKMIKVVDILDCGDKFAVRYLVAESPACECIYLRNGKILKTIHTTILEKSRFYPF